MARPGTDGHVCDLVSVRKSALPDADTFLTMTLKKTIALGLGLGTCSLVVAAVLATGTFSPPPVSDHPTSEPVELRAPLAPAEQGAPLPKQYVV